MNKIIKIGFLIIVFASNYAHAGSVSWQQPLAEEEPQFMVDAIGKRVYYFKEKKNIQAYDF